MMEFLQQRGILREDIGCRIHDPCGLWAALHAGVHRDSEAALLFPNVYHTCNAQHSGLWSNCLLCEHGHMAWARCRRGFLSWVSIGAALPSWRSRLRFLISFPAYAP